jgi:glycosyltransferase involved in cell wall biosynthesis
VKILNVIGSVDPRNGGTTDHVFSSSRVWSRIGHECHILCLDPADAACVAESPMITFALGCRGIVFRLFRRAFPSLRYGYTPRLVSWLRENADSYDAIVLNGLWNYTSYGSWRVLRKSTVLYYVCPHGMLDPWLKTARPMSYFIRAIFWQVFERKVVRDAQGIFFSSEEERQLASGSFLRRDKRPFYVVGYGAEDVAGDQDTQKSSFLSSFPQLRGRKLILFLSRIHPKKGLDLLIKAFADLADEYPAFDLVIVGPDNVGLTPKLAKIAVELGIERRIHWTGMLTGDEKWGAFRSAAFFTLPSHQENFGIAVVEAMAVGVPVLITKKVNIWREVEACGAGCAVADEVDSLIEGLRHMCDLPQSELNTMKINARNCFLQRFNIENNALELLELMIRLGEKGGISREGL